jgi:hypothetical protein
MISELGLDPIAYLALAAGTGAGTAGRCSSPGSNQPITVGVDLIRHLFCSYDKSENIHIRRPLLQIGPDA